MATESDLNDSQSEDTLWKPNNVKLGYKDMPRTRYQFWMIILYTLTVTASLFVVDIGLIFLIMGAISISMICFIMPGYFYL